MTPPAVTSFAANGGPVASFTTNNKALTAADFTVDVFATAGGTFSPWTVTSIAGGSGRFVANAKPNGPLSQGAVGTKFSTDGLRITITDNADTLVCDGHPINTRNVPFTLSAPGSATPLTYLAEKDPTAHTYTLKQSAGTFQLDDAANRVFVQAAADAGAINIGAEPGVDCSLTIDFGPGAFANAVTFDGGTGTGTHALTLANAGTLTVASTGPTSGVVTIGGQTITYKNVTSLVGGTPVTVSGSAPAAQVGVTYSTTFSASGGPARRTPSP